MARCCYFVAHFEAKEFGCHFSVHFSAGGGHISAGDGHFGGRDMAVRQHFDIMYNTYSNDVLYRMTTIQCTTAYIGTIHLTMVPQHRFTSIMIPVIEYDLTIIRSDRTYGYVVR